MSKRMSISLDSHSEIMLENMATDQGISQNEVINKAIKVEHFMAEAIKDGSIILVKSKDGQVTQVVFR